MKKIITRDNQEWRDFWRYTLFYYWSLSNKKDKKGTSPRERYWEQVKEKMPPVYLLSNASDWAKMTPRTCETVKDDTM